MESLMVWCRILGRHRPYRDAIAKVERIAIVHHLAKAEQVVAPLVDDDLRFWFRQLFDGLLVQMVVMFMGNEYEVGLGFLAIIGHRLDSVRHRVDFNLFPIEADSQTAMFDRLYHNGFARSCLVTVASFHTFAVGRAATEQEREKGEKDIF